MRTGMSSTRAVVIFCSLGGPFPHLSTATGFSNWDTCPMHVNNRGLLVLTMHCEYSMARELKLGMTNS